MFDVALEIADIYVHSRTLLGDPAGPFELVGTREVHRILDNKLAQVWRQSFTGGTAGGGDIFRTYWHEDWSLWADYDEFSVYAGGRFISGDDLGAVPQADGRSVAMAVSTPSGGTAFGVFLTLPWTAPGGDRVVKTPLRPAPGDGSSGSSPSPGAGSVDGSAGGVAGSGLPWWAIGGAALGVAGLALYLARTKR